MLNDKEHRAHYKLHQYWASLRGARLFPSESQIDPDAIEEIWPSCFLISIDAVTDRLGYKYSYLGHSLIEAYGGDSSSDPDIAMQLLATADMPMVKMFESVRSNFAPAVDESEFVNLKNLKVKYRTSLLPLGYKDDEVSHILGCMRWKVC
ncbi:MAG: PAS domain-containing protein [Alphaproteobacteria bacterium]|nr:PAS domain-containing protein [Alphaproteobacteria bacterium]